MAILGHTVLFCKPGHTMDAPTDDEFLELDKAEAKQAKVDEARERMRAAALRKRGASRDKALADLEADLAEMEAE